MKDSVNSTVEIRKNRTPEKNAIITLTLEQGGLLVEYHNCEDYLWYLKRRST